MVMKCWLSACFIVKQENSACKFLGVCIESYLGGLYDESVYNVCSVGRRFRTNTIDSEMEDSVFRRCCGNEFVGMAEELLRGTSLVADVSVFGGAFIRPSISLFLAWSILALMLCFRQRYSTRKKKLLTEVLLSLVSYCGYIFLHWRSAKSYSLAISDDENNFIHPARSLSDRA